MNSSQKQPKRHEILLLFLVPIVGLALGTVVTILFKINQTDYGNLVVNLFFLAACIGLQRIFKFSRQELGLEIIPGKVGLHVIVSTAVFTLYLLFYIFAIRITALKSFSADAFWGLLSIVVVIFTEELYFRGMVYGFFEKRYSARTALLVSAFVFGIFHARQGWQNMIMRMITGWLWGNVRYASGMIFLLIFPVHFAFNATWLLFVGNWNNPPVWAIYSLPILEILLGVAIGRYRWKSSH